MLINVISHLGRHVMNNFSSTDYNAKLLTQSPHWNEIWHNVEFGVRNRARTIGPSVRIYSHHATSVSYRFSCLLSEVRLSHTLPEARELGNRELANGEAGRLLLTPQNWYLSSLPTEAKCDKVEFTFGKPSRYIRGKR